MRNAWLIALVSFAANDALGADNVVTLSLKNHTFTPSEIRVKADIPTTVTLINNEHCSAQWPACSSLEGVS